MAQWAKTLPTKADDLGLIPETQYACGEPCVQHLLDSKCLFKKKKTFEKNHKDFLLLRKLFKKSISRGFFFFFFKKTWSHVA